jgi:uncharacterized membrane protein/uncharacterized membrane protein YbhN (UPF0104 family)
MRRRWVRIVAGVGSVGLAVALLAVALPAIIGVGWTAIATQLGGLGPSTLLWLSVIWFAGLWTYTFVLAGSLPGLRPVQAFVLNGAGSAVSNVLPFGGAAGVAVTFAMAGSWGHSRRAITVSTLVSGAWNVVFRLALPALGLAMLVLSGNIPDRRLTIAAILATILLICSLTAIVAFLVLNGTNRLVAPVSRRLRSLLRSRGLAGLRRAGVVMGQLRLSTLEVIRRGWPRLTLGMAGYLGMQYLLFWACLEATETQVSVSATIAAFGLSRLLATTSITPGGIGVTESGTAALLVALGASGGSAGAALILFGFFTHALEIPTGGVAWLTWAGARRWRVAAAGGGSPELAPTDPVSAPLSQASDESASPERRPRTIHCRASCWRHGVTMTVSSDDRSRGVGARAGDVRRGSSSARRARLLAMGLTRGWRSALAGTVAAIGALAAFTAVAGYALATWLPRSVLQLVIGVLLLVFGLQWLRKAILRSAELKALHDENDEFHTQTAAAARASDRRRFGLDSFGFVVSFKGVFLEGVEVVFIVITFGLNADNVPAAAVSAVAAAVVVALAGVMAARPLSSVPENALKYGVGLMLATYGSFWSFEGLGTLHGGASLTWPAGDWALVYLFVGWLALSRVLVTVLRSTQPASTADLEQSR